MKIDVEALTARICTELLETREWHSEAQLQNAVRLGLAAEVILRCAAVCDGKSKVWQMMTPCALSPVAQAAADCGDAIRELLKP